MYIDVYNGYNMILYLDVVIHLYLGPFLSEHRGITIHRQWAQPLVVIQPGSVLP